MAQTATLVGTVTDPSGAVLPNVTVTTTNAATGQSRTITTNESGQYALPDLQIGNYAAKASASGFKAGEKKDIVLNVGDRVRLDFKMEVGSASESVTVEASVVHVQTDSSEVSNVISGQQITQLATNGRSIYTLINLTPGASTLQGDFQNPTPVGGNGATSFNGNRQGHNIYLLDGAESDDRGGAGSSSVAPSLDALAEFQTLTSNYSAEYGLSSGGTMATALRSGTKQFHASAWEFVRNDAIQAHRFFDAHDSKKTKLNYNTYGFNVGGPVSLHQGGTPKTFFFYNMEWRKLIQGDSINQVVPLTATYGGDFTGNLPADFLDSAKNPIPNSGLHVPCQNQLSPAQQALFAGQTFSTPDASGSCAVNTKTTAALNPTFQPFTNNMLPFVNSNAAALLNIPKGPGNPTKFTSIFPAPTTGNQFIGGNNSVTTVREEIVRVDHNFTDKFSIFGHFLAEQISQGYGKTQWSGDNLPTASNVFGNPSYSGVIHTAYIINPSLVNEVAFNYNGNRINILPSGITQAPNFQFSRVFSGPNAGNRIPSINLSGSTGSNYTSAWEPWINKADDYQFRDDISWTRGKHQFKIGASWALYKKIQDVFTTTQGNFTFNGSFTGNDFADYLLGYAQGYSEDAIKDNGHWNNVSYAAYFQDNWRATSRLTLNLGLRWDGAPHTYEAGSRMSNFYPNLYNPANAATFDSKGNICSGADNGTTNLGCAAASPGLGSSPNSILAGVPIYLNGIGIDNKNGVPKGLVDNHWANFGPRVGFAYDVAGNGKTVVRGGFGLMYERVQGNDVYNTGGNVPFSANAGFNNVLLSDPNTGAISGTTNPLTVPVASVTGIFRNGYKLPQSYQYSAGVQQALGKSVLSISYVGSQNRHQNDYREINMPAFSDIPNLIANNNSSYNKDVQYLGFRSIKLAADEANAHYNSLQASLRGNFKSDLTYQVGYTLSKSIDPFGNGSSGGDLAAVSNPYVGWRYDVGPSAFDRRNVMFANFVYDLPFLKHNGNHLLRTTVGGWQVSGIVSITSGAPFDVTLNSNNAGSVSNFIQNSTNRPDGKITYVKKGIQWIDQSSLVAPADGTWGTLQHNAGRGPGRDNWNIALFKSFVFSEERGSRLEFRAESFNTFNHTQFQADTTGGINNSVGGDNFGQLTQTFDPRTMQLGLKLIF